MLTGVGQIQARCGHHVSGQPNCVARDTGLDGAGRVHPHDIDDDLEAQRQEGHFAREDGRVLARAKVLKVLAPRNAAGEAVRVFHDRERRLPIDVDADLPRRV